MGLDLRKDLALVSCFVGVCCIQCEQVTFLKWQNKNNHKKFSFLLRQLEQKNYLQPRLWT